MQLKVCPKTQSGFSKAVKEFGARLPILAIGGIAAKGAGLFDAVKQTFSKAKQRNEDMWVTIMPKVLIADDALFTRKVLKEILESEGCEVIEATNGQEAIDKFQSERPDLVLLDISMPGMDGLATLHAIRGIDPNAKVIMVSAMGQSSTVQEALKFGACDFIVKPFRPNQIREIVARCFFTPHKKQE